MICMECKNEFKPIRPWQRFCCEKCRGLYHRHEGDLPLTPVIRSQLQSLASAHGTTINEMACRILHQSMNPDGGPMEEIFGSEKK